MMHRLYTPARAFALAALLAVATLLFTPTSAQAHEPNDWFPFFARWAPETEYEFSYQQNVPTGAWRVAATTGVDEWNTNGTQWSPELHPTLPDSNFADPTSPCDNDHGAVFWQDDGAVYLGIARRCVVDSAIVGFSVIINSFYDWYTGTGIPPSGEFDLTSVMAHEFGHVTGGWWPSHWNEGSDADLSLCTSDASRHTMCSGQPSGVDWMRELDVHDVHTFQGAYAEPVPWCEVDYTITNTWAGNVQVDLVVHNNTPAGFVGWTATWTFAGDESVYNQWGVDVTQTGPEATAVGVGFGEFVAAESSVTVGFQATVTGTPTVPSPITCEIDS